LAVRVTLAFITGFAWRGVGAQAAVVDDWQDEHSTANDDQYLGERSFTVLSCEQQKRCLSRVAAI
jgi:hypothetical protein